MFFKPKELKVTTYSITHTPYEVWNTTRKSRSVYRKYHLNISIRTEIEHLFPNTSEIQRIWYPLVIVT
jgi:hypothetical protein